MSSNQNNNVCDGCGVCDPDLDIRFYECSGMDWCEICAEQVPCKNCGCWYFETETGLCDDCLQQDEDDDEDEDTNV